MLRIEFEFKSKDKAVEAKKLLDGSIRGNDVDAPTRIGHIHYSNLRNVYLMSVYFGIPTSDSREFTIKVPWQYVIATEYRPIKYKQKDK